jgi:hypothetical protein
MYVYGISSRDNMVGSSIQLFTLHPCPHFTHYGRRVRQTSLSVYRKSHSIEHGRSFVRTAKLHGPHVSGDGEGPHVDHTTNLQFLRVRLHVSAFGALFGYLRLI